MAKGRIYTKLGNFLFGILNLPKKLACWFVSLLAAAVAVSAIAVLIPLALIVGGELTFEKRGPNRTPSQLSSD